MLSEVGTFVKQIFNFRLICPVLPQSSCKKRLQHFINEFMLLILEFTYAIIRVFAINVGCGAYEPEGDVYLLFFLICKDGLNEGRWEFQEEF